MANEQSGVRFFIVLALLCFTTGTHGNDAGPILEAVQGFLSQASKGQSAGLNVWGSVLQGLLQSDGGKNLAQLFTSGRQSTTMNLISGLGALMQAQGQKSDGDDGKSSEGFDPAMLGTVMDLFASLNEAQNEDKVEEKTKPNKKVKREENSNTDWEPILSVIGNAVGSMMTGDGKSSGGGAGLESLMSFLPVIMSSIGGRHHPHSSENVPHHDHAPFLPPFLENIHEYWDHFLNSQFGKTLYESSGLSAMMDQFRDKSGKVVPERIFDSLENNTFRRKWIRGISSFVAEWANHISDTETQKKYLETVKVIVNSFLQSEGYPKSAFLDWNKPGDSISNLVDYVVKKQLSMSVKSGHYIKPAVEYFQVIFGQSQKAGILASMTAQTVESRLTNTLEAELIEPILRANRGYKFIKRNPECAKYVICAINADAENNSVGLRPAAAKASNMAVAWFASGKDSFFELYGATSETDCEEFDNNCNDFHVEDSKATTEYFHNEL